MITYISFNRNGICTREFSLPTTFSMHISHFYLVIIVEEIPIPFSSESLVRGSYIVPKKISTKSYDDTLSYDANFFQSSQMNIGQRLLYTYRIVFANMKHRRGLSLFKQHYSQNQ